jgi:pimeloyl-ACP methyl ester carboxylesterase
VSVNRLRTGFLAVLVCTMCCLVAPHDAGAQGGSLAFQACQPEQIFVPVAGLECGTLVVPFDRADPGVGDIGLAVQRVRASGVRKGVIVLLAGGPGQPALPAFEEFLAPLARSALGGFELVAFDQRGTGQSQGLECPESESSSGDGISAYLEACGVALGATRAFYTSQESVEDLDTLRQALGGTPLSIFAVSYGTRVAGMYAREHPQGVARMVLDSAIPVSGSNPLYLERVHALRRVLDEGICGAGACRSFTRNAYADLVRLVGTLQRHPLRARIREANGRPRQVRVTEAQLLELLFTLDLAPTVREIVPAAIAAAVHGDPAPLAQLTAGEAPEAAGGESQLATGIGPVAGLLSSGQPPRAHAAAAKHATPRAPLTDELISTTLFAATYCVESQLPWSPESAPSTRPAAMRARLATLPMAATAPFAAKTLGYVSALPYCLKWPATPAAPPAPSGTSATPTLILSGDDDLRAPYEQALTIAAGYSDAQLLRVPDVGHSTASADRTGCAKRAMIQFLTAGSAPSTCPESSEAQAVALPPRSLSNAPSAASRAQLARSAAAATASALEYLFGQAVPAGGGLAGGYWSYTAHGVELHDLSDTAGVALSGTIHLSGTTMAPIDSAHLHVSGRISGELTLDQLALAGRLDGTTVHTRLAAL